MPKPILNTQPSATDFIFSYTVKTPVICGRCGTRKSSGSTMWFHGQEKVNYCTNCRNIRITPDGIAEAVGKRLAGMLMGQPVVKRNNR